MSINEARRLSQQLKPSRKWQTLRRSNEPPAMGTGEFAGIMGEVWMNHLYAVNVFRKGDSVLIGICSVDGEARHDWRDFQRIKNDVVGEEWEAVELYPAESRLIDPSNYFYLWARPSFKEIGKNIGRQIIPPAQCLAPQRGWHPDDQPEAVVQVDFPKGL